jgi:hypothetical protein
MGGRHVFVILLSAASGGIAVADGSLRERTQIHGFASQAVVQTSDNRYFGNSPSTSFDFTEIGLNGSFQLNPKVLFSAQMLVRRAGEMNDGTPSLDYGLADATVISAVDGRAGVRLGRIKNPLGLYNETRDVPFTRPSIFLPLVYYDRVRNLIISSDGLMAYGESFGASGNYSITLGAGQTVIDDNVEWTVLGADFDGALEPGKAALIGSLWYTTPDERLKGGLSGVTTSMRFDPKPGSALSRGSVEFFYWIASLQYNSEQLTLSAEYSRVPTEWESFGPYFPFSQQTAEGYYLQGAYRVLPELELMMRYEEGYADRDDRDGETASALTGGFTPPFDFYSKVFTAGLRWDILPNLMVRAEYQRHQGTYALSIRENPDPSQLVEDWDVFAASISVRF